MPIENQLILFFGALLTGVAVENVVFARALGLSKMYMLLHNPRTATLYGGLFTWLLTVSAVFVGVVNSLITGMAVPAGLIAAPMYFLCAGGVYVVTFLYIRRSFPAFFADISGVLPIIAFNTALFGAFYVALGRGFSILQTVGYSLGTGIGYTLAMLIIYYARKRLAISPVPRSFRGLPILFLYIGFLSLAIYGLTGHGLPT